VDQFVSRDPDITLGRNEDRQTAYRLRCEHRTSGRRSVVPCFAVSEMNLHILICSGQWAETAVSVPCNDTASLHQEIIQIMFTNRNFLSHRKRHVPITNPKFLLLLRKHKMFAMRTKKAQERTV
jgi:hypothetical protein